MPIKARDKYPAELNIPSLLADIMSFLGPYSINYLSPVVVRAISYIIMRITAIMRVCLIFLMKTIAMFTTEIVAKKFQCVPHSVKCF